jgi:gamma-glutamyltranspeptidase/glutathione hydrolase
MRGSLSRRELLGGALGVTVAADAACTRRSSEPPPASAATAARPATSTTARAGVVASSQRLATDAGVSILAAGGNAADAAIATAAALQVTEPMSTGLGGDCFALYFDARTRALTALNGSGRSPAKLTLEMLGGAKEWPRSTPHAVTVPGACAGWCDLLARHGRLPMARVLAPAIGLAEQGFAVGPITAHFWELGIEKLLRKTRGGLAFTVDGRAPRAGETFRNPAIARTLRIVAQGGKDAFYRGTVAEAIVRALQAEGGVMSMEDLASHESTWDAPISTDYRGTRVWECPPNGQGLTALLALNLLEGFDVRSLPPLGAERLHLVIQALRLAFADTRHFVADPSLVRVPVQELLSKDYAARRRALLDPRGPARAFEHGAPIAGSDTVYFCVVDAEGNACSFINSNYNGFGTGIVPEGVGFALQNRGACFSLDPTHANALAPRKRPYHTIIPGMLMHLDGSLLGPFGVMGGFMQPQGHVQVLLAMLDDGLTPQAALDRPRVCIEPVDGAGSRVQLEEGIPRASVDDLRARGHAIAPDVGGFERAVFGRGQVIVARGDGPLVAGSDPRADGYARSTS